MEAAAEPEDDGGDDEDSDAHSDNNDELEKPPPTLPKDDKISAEKFWKHATLRVAAGDVKAFGKKPRKRKRKKTPTRKRTRVFSSEPAETLTLHYEEKAVLDLRKFNLAFPQRLPLEVPEHARNTPETAILIE